MSSVQRFLRQIPTGTNFVGNASGLIDAAYDFIPTNGNYVGNYPPGFVTQASNTSLFAALKAAEKSTGTSVVRDMGKTIYAPVSSTKSIDDLTGDAGYFREYQLLRVNPIKPANPGFLGGSTGSTFGVVGQGVSSGDGSPLLYATFYVPVVVNGVYAGTSSSIPAQLAGGQL